MIKHTGIPIASIHLMGHSAGAHIVGGAGALLTSGRISRITGKSCSYPFKKMRNQINSTFEIKIGLDPGVLPGNNNDPDTLLDITDADFIDVIHTNGKFQIELIYMLNFGSLHFLLIFIESTGGVVANGEVGIYDAIGHVDFYVTFFS